MATLDNPFQTRFDAALSRVVESNAPLDPRIINTLQNEQGTAGNEIDLNALSPAERIALLGDEANQTSVDAVRASAFWPNPVTTPKQTATELTSARARDYLSQRQGQIVESVELGLSGKTRSATSVNQRSEDAVNLTAPQYLRKYGNTAENDRERSALRQQALALQARNPESNTGGFRNQSTTADAVTSALGTALAIGPEIAGSAVAVADDPLGSLIRGANSVGRIGSEFLGLGEEYEEATQSTFDRALQFTREGFLPNDRGLLNIEVSPAAQAALDGNIPLDRDDLISELFGLSDDVRDEAQERLSDQTRERRENRDQLNQEYSDRLDAALPEDAGILDNAINNAKKIFFAIDQLETEDIAIGSAESIPYLFAAGQAARTGSVRGARAAQERLDDIKRNRGPRNTDEVVDAGIARTVAAEAEAATTNAVVAATGVLEGSANAADVYNTVIDTSFEDLESNSPQFRALVSAGVAQEEARRQLAQQASTGVAISSGVIAAGIGRATGTVAERAAGGIPTSASAVGDIVTAAAGEAVEELVQSGTGQLASNIAVRQTSDETQEVAEGAAVAAGEGAVIGAFSAGATTAATRPIQTTAEVATLAGRGLSATGSAVVTATRRLLGRPTDAPVEAQEQDELLAEVENLTRNTRNEEGQVDTAQLDTAQQATLARARALVSETRDNAALQEQADTPAEDIDAILASADALLSNAPSLAQDDGIQATTDEDIERTNQQIRDIPAEELTPDNVDDFLASLSLQVDLENSDSPLNIEGLMTARQLLQERGAQPEQLQRLDAVIQARSTAAQVSDEIRIGNQQWRGGATYLNNIVQGLTNSAPSTVAYNLSELQRFTNFITQKATAFAEAPFNAEVLRPDGSPYLSLDGTPLTNSSRNLVATIAADRDALQSILATANDLIETETVGTEARQILDTLAVAPVAPEDVIEGSTPLTAETVDAEPLVTAEVPVVDTEAAPAVETPEGTLDLEDVGVVETTVDTEAAQTVVDATVPADSEVTEQPVEAPVTEVAATEEPTVTVENSPGTNAIREGLANTEYVGTPTQNETTNQFFGRNEFQQEARIRPTSQIGNNTEAFDEENIRELVTNRGSSQSFTESLLGSVANLNLFEEANKLNTRFRGILEAGRARVAAPNGNALYLKTYTGSKSNFEDINGDLAFPLRNGSTASMIDYINTESNIITKESIRSVAGLDTKEEPSPELMTYLADRGLGKPETELVRQLGANALRAAGVTFTGETGNTSERMRDAVGQMVLDHMVEEGYINLHTLSRNAIARAGGRVTNDNYPARQVNSYLNGTRLPRNTDFRYNGVIYRALGNGTARILTQENGGRRFVNTDTIRSYSINTDNEYVQTVRDGFRGEGKPSTSAFSNLFNTDANRTKPSLFEPRTNSRSVTRYPHIRAGDRLARILRKGASIPFFLNQNMLDLQEALGETLFKQISGFREVPEGHNRNLALSIEGKNQSVNSNFEQLGLFLDDMRSGLSERGEDTPLNAVPFFFNFDIGANNRLRVNSQTFNYQSNKMHRAMAHTGFESFTKGGNQDNDFLVGVAQAFGFDVDKLSLDTSVNLLLNGTFPAVDAMAEYQRTGTMTAENAQLIADFSALHEGNQTLLALDEYARYREAPVGADLQTALDVEIDGVNNGPVTALMHAMTDETKLRHYLRTAGIVAAETEDFRTHGQRVEADKLDGLYEESSKAIQNNVGNVETSPQQRAALNAQIALKIRDGKIQKLEDDSLVVKRSDGKGITTVLFYGAGDKSVIRSDVTGMLNAVYDELQNIQDSTVSEADKAAARDSLFREVATAGTDTSDVRQGAETSPRPVEDMRAQFNTNLTAMRNAYANQGHVDFTLPQDVQDNFLAAMINTPSSYGNVKVNAVRDWYEEAMGQFGDIIKLGTVSNIIARTKVNGWFDTERSEQGISALEDISTDRKNELLRERASQLPNLRLSYHNDFSDAIPWYKWEEGRQRDGDSRRFGLVVPFSGDRTFTNSATLGDIGAGANPVMIQAIADASTIIHTMNTLDNFKTVYDGLYVNVLNQDASVPVFNQGYVQSQRDHNPMALASDAYSRTTDVPIEFLDAIPQGDYGSLAQSLLPELRKELRLDYRTWQNNLNEVTAERGIGTLSATELRQRVFDAMTTLGQTSASLAEERGLASRFLTNNAVVANQFGSVNDRSATIGAARTPRAETNAQNLVERDVVRVTTSGNVHNLVDFLTDNELFVGSSEVATQVILNQVVNLSEGNDNYKGWLRSVLINQILAPAFQRRGSIPQIIVTDDAGMRNRLGVTTPVKGAYSSETDAIYLNLTRGGVSAETLFHELVHAALDSQITPQVEAQLNALVEEFGNDTVNNPRELLAWGLTNFNEVTRLAQVTTEQQPINVHGRILAFIRRLISRFVTPNAERNSVLSFLFETAHGLANNDRVNRTLDTPLALQEDYENNMNKDPQWVFDELVLESNVSGEQQIRLNNILNGEILPILTNGSHRLNSRVNAAEALKELREAGTDIAPDSLAGILGMSPVESYVYESYRTIVEAGLQDFDISSRNASRLFEQVREALSPSDFNRPEQYSAIFEAGEDSIPRFLALIRTNEQFRELVSNANLLEQTERGAQAYVISTVQRIANFLLGFGTGTSRIRDLTAKLERLARNVTAIDTRHKSFLERFAGRAYVNAGRAYNNWGNATDNALANILNSNTATSARRAAGVVTARARAAVTGENNARQAANYNRLYQAVHRVADGAVPLFLEEVNGTNDQNRRIRELYLVKNKTIAGARDSSIKAHERAINTRLSSTALEAENSVAMTRVLLETDITSLQSDGFALDDIERVIRSSTERTSAIRALESEIGELAGDQANIVIKSAQSLGNFLATGVGTEAVTYPNAFAALTDIGNLYSVNLTGLEAKVDSLATLVALDHADLADARTRVSNLYSTDKAGMEEMMQLHDVNKRYVLESQLQGNRFATLKGNVAEVYNNFHDIRYVPASQIADRESEGYTLVREIPRDNDDPQTERIFMMFSDVGGLQGYQQGLYSLANNSLSGVQNLDNRVTTDGIDDYGNMQKFSARMRLNKQGALRRMNGAGSTAVPNGTVAVLNSRGNVTGYRYTIPKQEREDLLGRDARFERVLPAMFGRAIETTNTVEFNMQVNRALKATYDADRRAGNLRGYIEVSATSTNARGREAFRMMPPAARADLREIWGERAYVRSGLFDQVYGFREVSIAAAIRGNSDSPTWTSSMARRVFGRYTPNAIRSVARTERALAEISTFVKDLIVVRGVEVLFGNLISNTVQLVLSEDISLVEAIRLQVEGLNLAKRYQENASRLRQLDVELSIEPDNRQLIAERDRLRRDQDNNGAQELIDAGLLTAIVEDVTEDDNPFSYGQRLSDAVTGATSNLPESVKWIGSNLVAGKDTEIYRTLYMFTQLGDFGARYAMINNRRNKGTLGENATTEALDAFVNYDLPSNKYLQYLGDVGQLWFFKYFFRIQQVIIRNTVRNPRRAAELFAFASVTGADISTYFDAFFLTNSITNKMGLFDYLGNGFESLPVVQVYDAI